VARTATGLGQEERREVSIPLVSLYFALGRAGQAEGILNGIQAFGGVRAEFLSNIGDTARLQQLVATWPESAPQGDGIALMNRVGFFIETGKLDAAERELVLLERVTTNQGSAGFRSVYLDERTIELLRESIAIKARGLPGLASINGHYAISQLARALETAGQLDEAIALLADAGDKRGDAAIFVGILDSWMLNRAHLARLYRKNGQPREARASRRTC
jgi:hypothetical protein